MGLLTIILHLLLALTVTARNSIDFVDGADLNVEYTYDGNGNLTSDANKGIALIEYDDMNMPRRIQFTNGNATEYVYTVDGRKLRSTYYTAVPNITVPMHTSHVLTEAETLCKDSTEYLLGGVLTRKNDTFDKYLFNGGYCSLYPSTTPNFHYYNRDHLGNIREVIAEEGTVEQVTHYYPFGTPYSDSSVTNPALQPYKYNGKKFDAMHGLHTYDYGARQYDPLLIVWHGVDKLTGENPNVSGYTYCANNPVKLVDKDGNDYDVFYDGSSITIKSLYYTDESSKESAIQATDFWNGLNERFTMDGLPVIFDFKVSVVSSADIPDGVKVQSFIKAKVNENISSNSYLESDLDDPNQNGGTRGGRLVFVTPRSTKTLTGAHEIGHTVGLQHSGAGLMTAASSDPERSDNVNKTEIKNIIKRAVNGKPSKDENGNPAGRGHFHNNSNNPNVKFKYKMEDLEE